jgi:hypothetical protein
MVRVGPGPNSRDASLMAANVIQHRFDDMRLYTNISHTRARRPLLPPVAEFGSGGRRVDPSRRPF